MDLDTYSSCTLCPRMCGVDRTAGERGFCGMPAHPVAARAAAHYWVVHENIKQYKIVLVYIKWAAKIAYLLELSRKNLVII